MGPPGEPRPAPVACGNAIGRPSRGTVSIGAISSVREANSKRPVSAHNGRRCTRFQPSAVAPEPRSRHSTVQSGLYFAAILIAHLLGSRELLPGLARLWMWISLLSPHRKAASQLLMEQVSFGGSERVLQARFEARKQIAERPLGANRG
jgi:hypothetical protein